jgi:beta-galactosidase
MNHAGKGAAGGVSISLDGKWLLAKDGRTRAVTVPHDWAIEGPFDPEGACDTGKLPYRGHGVYSRTFKLSADERALLDAGGEIYLEFDGVMADPLVEVNGMAAGGWDYGYMSFTLPIGRFIAEGENTLKVTCDTTKHHSRWYPGAGIYRSVRMKTVPRDHILPGSLFITTPEIASHPATVQVEYELSESGPRKRTFTVANPVLWDVDNPHLYTLELEGETFRYGIRDCTFTPDDGFILNGRRLQLKGVCLHSDLGPLGMAFSRDAARRQLSMMKDMGVNAIRTAHNPPAPELLDLCDEMGFVVWDEAFDKWDGTAGRGADQPLEEYISRNLRQFIRRDRNHPSVVVWSIGNEISAASEKYPDGVTRERCTLFRQVCLEIDVTRPVGIGAWQASTSSCFEDLDVTGWNYARRYLPIRGMYPDKPIIYTESCSSFSCARFHQLPPPRGRKDYALDRLLTDGYDLTAAWYSDIPDAEFNRVEKDAYLAGEFVWTGIDYLGEPSPYHNGFKTTDDRELTPAELHRSSHYGIVGLDGIPKDRFHLYCAYWNQSAETAHLVPDHWNLPVDQRLPVMLYTSGDEAELFLNGRSLGRRRKVADVPGYPVDHDDAKDNENAESWDKNPYYAILAKYRLIWNDVVFEPGELVAVCYRNGREVARASLTTAGAPAKVKLERDPYSASDADVVFVRVSLTDAAGTRIPDANTRVDFNVEGTGEIVSVGNADPAGLDSFKDVASHPLFFGYAVAVVRRKGPGEIRLKAAARGLQPARFVF